MLVAVAIGAVVAGSASLATHLTASPQPLSLPTSPSQIANAEELPAPGLAANSSTTATATSGAPTTTATSTTTTTSPTTTAPTSTTANAPAPPATDNPPPNPPPAAPSSQRPPTSPSAAEQVFQLVNNARADAGCDSVHEDSRLDNSAVAHSEDMANNGSLSHNGPGSTPFNRRIASYGYTGNELGENIAEGYTSAQQVFNAWMSDSGHRDNILNCQFVAMGVGVDTQGWYWTQDFGS
jgi:uncharacterized protein YkwD